MASTCTCTRGKTLSLPVEFGIVYCSVCMKNVYNINIFYITKFQSYYDFMQR